MGRYADRQITPGAIDPDYGRMAGPARPVVLVRPRRVRLPDGRIDWRYMPAPAWAIDVGRAPEVSSGAGDFSPESDILRARKIRAAALSLIRDGGAVVSVHALQKATGETAPIVKRMIDRDPLFLLSEQKKRGARRAITLAPGWEEHGAGDVPDPPRVRWGVDAVIRYFRDCGPEGSAHDIAEYSAIPYATANGFCNRHPGLFHSLRVVDNRLIRKLTVRARRLLLPALLVAALLLPALLAAPASAQQTAPGYSTPRPTPTAQTSRYRRYDTGGRSSSTPRCRWIPSLGWYQCDTDGSRYGSRRSDSETVPGTDRRAPGVPTPRPTPAN